MFSKRKRQVLAWISSIYSNLKGFYIIGSVVAEETYQPPDLGEHAATSLDGDHEGIQNGRERYGCVLTRTLQSLHKDLAQESIPGLSGKKKMISILLMGSSISYFTAIKSGYFIRDLIHIPSYFRFFRSSSRRSMLSVAPSFIPVLNMPSRSSAVWKRSVTVSFVLPSNSSNIDVSISTWPGIPSNSNV